MADLNVTGCSDEELIAALRGQEEKADIQGDTSMPYGNKADIQGDTSMPYDKKIGRAHV